MPCQNTSEYVNKYMFSANARIDEMNDIVSEQFEGDEDVRSTLNSNCETESMRTESMTSSATRTSSKKTRKTINMIRKINQGNKAKQKSWKVRTHSSRIHLGILLYTFLSAIHSDCNSTSSEWEFQVHSHYDLYMRALIDERFYLVEFNIIWIKTRLIHYFCNRYYRMSHL